MYGNCPYCKNSIAAVTIAEVPSMGGEIIWRCLTYSCPTCNAVLSVAHDPISLKADILDAVGARGN